ncbi:unnamed protein product [Spirodela intermedia]|uniref:Uncharacterized protein n=1 Tax=Spirodela intermedia TaxID=51605 RepID=A0A7I8J1W6_SPIIN|nr:unnamed protein product [Spirodela intermedia]CAA6664148.1 unnamed protein product [Spirodela intermedia]
MARRRWSRAEEERVVALVEKCRRSRRKLQQVHSHVLTPDPDCAGGQECCWEALHSYGRMHRSLSSSPRPLAFTLSSALKACAKLSAVEEGTQIHAHAFKYGFQSDARVQTTLVDLYGFCRRPADARRVFDRIVSASGGIGDVQVWNTMIAGYHLSGDADAARRLFDEMPERNTFSWMEMVRGYAATGRPEDLRRLLKVLPLARDDVDRVVISTAVITGFLKCGDAAAARVLFDEMPTPDVAAWNAIISGYAGAGLPEQAVDLFRLLLEDCTVRPNRATVVAAAAACAQLGSAESARWVADCVDRRGAELLNGHAVAALVDMHAKCGDLRRACGMFRRWNPKDLVCYSSMIAAFGVHGRGKEAIELFGELLAAGLRPDGVCFVSVLAACSHAGLVDEGQQIFQSMRRDHGISPATEHYALCTIAEEMLPAVGHHAGVWGALLGACRSHRNVPVAEEAARWLMELEPNNAGNYVLLSNVYAAARRWEDAARVRGLMRQRGMRKPPGWSWLEHSELQPVLAVLGWELSGEGLPLIFPLK